MYSRRYADQIEAGVFERVPPPAYVLHRLLVRSRTDLYADQKGDRFGSNESSRLQTNGMHRAVLVDLQANKK
jgi:hypothetical protein